MARPHLALLALLGMIAAGATTPAPAGAQAGGPPPGAAPRPNVPTTWTDHSWTGPDGTRFHYLEQGQGVPVILLHGAGSSGSSWFVDEPGTAQMLARTNRVIAPDARGMGQSESGPPGNNETMIRDVVALLDHLGIKQAHIAGYSMGGALTAGLMRIAPDRFLTASVMGLGVKETPEWAGKAPKDPPLPAGSPPSRTPPGQSGPPPAPPGAPAMNGSPEPYQDVDLPSIRFPVLSVVGEYDKPYTNTSRMKRELWDYTFVMIPGANHPQARRTRRLADALVRFITAYDRQGPIAAK